MKLKTLVENTTSKKEIKSKHGVSFYIEAVGKKILFDTGSNDLFIENAKKMNVVLSEVDYLIISHGHVDHGGALEDFLKINKTAKVFVRESAFDKHFTKVIGLKVNIGIDENQRKHPRICFTRDIEYISDGLILISDIKGDRFYPTSNKRLFKRIDYVETLDNFSHEQSLIINENGKHILISSCSHTGIVNIIEKGKTLIKDDFDVVIGGFHLYNPVGWAKEKKEIVFGLAEVLSLYDSTFYTCHCTGESAYNDMKTVLKERLHYLSAGSEIEVK